MPKASKIFLVTLGLFALTVLGTGTRPPAARNGEPAGQRWWPDWLARFELQTREAAAVPASSGMLPSALEFGPVLDPDPTPRVKGIYLTAWTAGNKARLNQLVDFSNRTEINAMVIDVKDDTGIISYPSRVPLARTLGAGRTKFDPKAVLEVLRRNRIYPIARIVVFKDPHLAAHRTDLAVKSTQGGLWRDFKGLYWVDPYNKAVWDYTVAIAEEAAGLGFKEIQFDYVRFTSDGVLKYCLYPASDNRRKADVIRDFLKYAYARLNPLGVKVSADVFGLTCSATDDLGIGQVLEKVAEGVDVICPMVYPSHYRKGAYQLPDPDRAPYETVYQSLTHARRRLGAFDPGRKVVLRPWLQDFSLRNRYGREQLLAQIKAVEDAGFEEWIFWNPGNSYDLAKYRPAPPAATPVAPAQPDATPVVPAPLETTPVMPATPDPNLVVPTPPAATPVPPDAVSIMPAQPEATSAILPTSLPDMPLPEPTPEPRTTPAPAEVEAGAASPTAAPEPGNNGG
jgi:hypothetical protein